MKNVLRTLQNKNTFKQSRPKCNTYDPISNYKYRYNNFIRGKLQVITFSIDRPASEDRVIPHATYDKSYYEQEDAFIMTLIAEYEALRAEEAARLEGKS